MGWFRKRQAEPEPEPTPRVPTHYLYRIGLTPVGAHWDWEAFKVPVYDHIHEGRAVKIGGGFERKRFQAQAAAHACIDADKTKTSARGATQWEHIK